MESACCLALGVFLIKEEMGVFSVFCLFFDAGGSACGYKCVYTHTHTLHMRYSSTSHDVSPGVVTRHLEGPKSPDRLNVGIYVFVYTTAQSTHVYHVCWEAVQHIFLPKKNAILIDAAFVTS